MAPRPDDELKKQRIDYFKKRFPGFKKKATELSVLCGNSVAFICHTPDDGKVHVWPENRQELQQIVSKFKRQSREKRIKNACDVYDGLSAEELRDHLSIIKAQLVGIRQKKEELMLKKKTNEEQRGSGSSTRVSQLGFGQTLVSNSRDVVGVSGMEPGDYIPADSQLGFHGGDYVPAADSMAVAAYNPSGFCGGDCIWDPSRLDLEFFGFRLSSFFTFIAFSVVFMLCLIVTFRFVSMVE